MRVSVLGMGQMGRALARRALGHGHQVVVWNRTPGRVPELVVAGGVGAPTPADAARGADVVLVVVADDAAVGEVCLGHEGALAASVPAPCSPT
jgi:3-hydroxyisobutyrate dehydrogenase-like beta-hydroxyacid dehydrogenase